jgi:hypothetical protein
MAPDTEPTDEELAVVMRAARTAVLERKKKGEERLRLDLERALAETKARAQTTK